jgi:thymidylate kinase
MLARGGLDRMEREDADFHARVTEAFLAAADPAWQAAHPEVGPVSLVEAGGAAETVTARIVETLVARWPETFRPLAESQSAGPLSSSSAG